MNESYVQSGALLFLSVYKITWIILHKQKHRSGLNIQTVGCCVAITYTI